MMKAGMNAALPQPIHLWPSERRRPNIKAIKSQFARGMTFYGRIENIVTVYDLPAGQTVILHAGPKTRIKIKI